MPSPLPPSRLDFPLEDDDDDAITARAWRGIAKTFRAEWSPWCHDTTTSKRYRLSPRHDRLGRRFLMERDWEPKDFSGAAYSSSSRGGGGGGVLPQQKKSPRPNLKKFQSSLSAGTRFDGVTWVRLARAVEGVLVLTRRALKFASSSRGDDPIAVRLNSVERVAARRYVLERRALEIFRVNGTSLMFALASPKDAKELWSRLKKKRLPLLAEEACPASFSGLLDHHHHHHHQQADGKDLIIEEEEGAPFQLLLLKNPKITELWRKRHISNYAYLATLNDLAGRTFLDLAQWPVFPWILADDSRLRDLSKPMGAHGPPSRVEAFLDRYRNFEDPCGTPPFMFGSHYSSAAIVLHFLVRVQPFSELAVELQGRTFDVPDRLFHSVRESWTSATESMCDVKELVPELFYLPEVLLNDNRLPLGARQKLGVVVDDVALPEWAEDAFDFVRLHRQALESDRVSSNLHRWIDLVFGVNQRGDRAVRASNVFYHLTYEGAVDAEAIQDPEQRAATVEQIKHFGQTPPQLLSTPHPPRLPPHACALPLFAASSDDNNNNNNINRGATADHLRLYEILRDDHRALANRRLLFLDYSRRRAPPTRGAAVAVSLLQQQKLVACYEDGSVASWKWSDHPDGTGLPFDARFDPKKRRISAAASVSCVRILVDDLVLSVRDGFLRLDDVESANLVAVGKGAHRAARITRVAVDALDPRLLVTGADDGTLCVWTHREALADALTFGADDTDDDGDFEDDLLAPTRAACFDCEKGKLRCTHVLFGHQRKPVSSLAYSATLDIVVSAVEATCCVHAARQGKFVHKIDRSCESAVDLLAIFDASCEFVAHARTTRELALLTLNAKRRARVRVDSTYLDIAPTRDADKFACAAKASIHLRQTHTLSLIHTLDLSPYGTPLALSFSPTNLHLFIATNQGAVLVLADPKSPLHSLDAALNSTIIGLSSIWDPFVAPPTS
ncbi:hypothetical protein CTAYLR_004083 [Chrysophaeum taylorii]|uniref:BEACH domain-containing protein n=1 Tax=Chrysophaeum taylorii TaxID=2483200 RepID=A0AAD7UEP8_9STRA|nr:hypothetical protein CTAYLR_004083 [Chrysophaeum taylorii]